jgi:hypothetical protein
VNLDGSLQWVYIFSESLHLPISYDRNSGSGCGGIYTTEDLGRS